MHTKTATRKRSVISRRSTLPVLSIALVSLAACSSSSADQGQAGGNSSGATGLGTTTGGSTGGADSGSASGMDDASPGDASGSDASAGDSTTGASGGAMGDDGSSAAGEPSAQALLDKVASCGSSATAIKGGFGLDGSGSLSMYQCGSAVYWKADMDVDCDGIQTPPCNTDQTGQPQTSIVDAAPHGDVDPTQLPYFVIPLGKPETPWYTAYGIQLGQVGAVIYNGQVRYGIFADEAGGWFIGEASYAMCQLFLGMPSGGNDPCDPNQGGIDPADVTYVTFTGPEAQAQGSDIYDHARHTAMGIAAAKAWVAQ